MLNSLLLPPLYTKAIHLPAAGGAAGAGGPQVFPRAHLTMRMKELRLQPQPWLDPQFPPHPALHRRAMGPQQQVPGRPPGEAQSVKGTWGGKQL